MFSDAKIPKKEIGAMQKKLVKINIAICFATFVSLFDETTFGFLTVRPTLPDLPYPWGTGIEEVPDPEVLWSGTNCVGLPGDGGQKQAPHAVTREGGPEGRERRSEDSEREDSGIGEGEGSERPENGEERKAWEASAAVVAVESG
ncbi:hypothetical protein NDU88_004064 [Pleurodeles waltl]|uniref:Uncharacterized protein n=1 Tax=Pleurodeles waltl TaxID=8319 RepID=A0AAV7QDT5_PLEWA|nr:hypothetical protein NDU88_004064 [Pleurodeles waltl]